MANRKRRPPANRSTPARGSSSRASAARTRSTPTQSSRASGASTRNRSASSPADRSPAADGDTPLRLAVAARSRGIVVWLSRQPQFLLPAVMVGLMVAGLAAPVALAVPALLVIVVFVGWLAFLSWPVLDTGPRAMRLVLVGVVVFALVGRVAGWF